MKKIIILMFLMIFLSSNIFSQESQKSTDTYIPYDPSEFPSWAHDLRRFEIVFFGTIPFSFLYASAGYSIYTYASHNWDPAFAPAILGNRTPPLLTNSEKVQIIGISLGLSTVAALIDFFLGVIKDDE